MTTTKHKSEAQRGDLIRVTPGVDWDPVAVRVARSRLFEVYRAYERDGLTWVEVVTNRFGRWHIAEGFWEYADTAPVTEKPEYNSTCPRCDAPAYRGFVSVECSARCCEETTPRNYAPQGSDQEQVTIPF